MPTPSLPGSDQTRSSQVRPRWLSRAAAHPLSPVLDYLRQSPYTTAVLSVGIALVLMLGLDPLAAMTQTPFLLFFGAVVISAWQGGIRSGLMSTLLGALISNYFFLAPLNSFALNYTDIVRLTVFVLEGILISVLCGSLRLTNQKLDRNLQRLRSQEFSLQRSTAILDAINASTPTLLYVKDRQGRIQMGSAALLQLVGKSGTEIIGSTNADILPDPQAVDQITANDQRVMETGEVLTFEEVIDFPDGTRTYLTCKSPYRDEQGRIVGLIGVSTDISDRKQAENALRQSEERLRLALDAGNMGAWEWNLETNVQRWDVNQYKLFGLDKDRTELKAGTFFQFIHPDDLPRTQAITEQVLAQGGSFSTEFRIIRPDGNTRWLSSQGMVLQGSDQQPRRMIGVNFDITARKQAEAEREQLLCREQAARQEAEAANRIKDEFLAVLSHELRSPLNPILGWARLLRLGRLDAAKTRNALETIERNAQLQTQLIEDLLDVSRILQGKLGLTMATVDLSTVIDAALETVQLAAEAKSIEVRREARPASGHAERASPCPSPFLVLGDAARLQQVVWNLLSNAVKFTPEGGWVEVRLEQIDRGVDGWMGERVDEYSPLCPSTHPPIHPLTSYAQITVTDTGKGIHPDFLPYVFEYFRQADSTTTRKFGGLGLGLAIVRHLVELHGGTAEADSPGEGLGATFRVRLPLVRPETQQTQAQDPAPADPHPATLAGLQILVVDDQPDARELITFMLEAAGATVTAAPSAAAALEIFPAVQPNLLVSDIGMPDLDGYDLMRQIRALPPNQGGQVPAIALTAYAGEINQQRAIAAGFQHHLAKPVELQALMGAIAALVERG
jgi:PAS domain S-box-containing protein